MKILVKILLNTLLGIVLILVWLRFVNINQILTTLATTRVVFLLPMFFFMLLSPVIRALRLKIFLSNIKKVSGLNLIFLNGVAQMLNYFIPIRGGEIAKGIYLSSTYDLPMGKSLVWIFLDRFVDFLVVVVLAIGLFFVIPTSLNIMFITIIIIIIFISFILIYLMTFQVSLAKKIFSFLSTLLILPIIKRYFDRLYLFLIDSFTVFKRHPAELVLLFLISMMAYAADAAIWYFTFLALSSSQSFLKLYLGQLISALTYLIPAAPGYVGSAEASGLLVLSGVLGVNANLASAMIVLFHIATALFIIIFGLISVFSLKIDLNLIFQKILRSDK